MPARYAIYYAPDPASDFWRRASLWLGRDAFSGQEREQPVPEGLGAEEFAAHTADPRHYGFHATLKAPFELADGATEEALVTALNEFADMRAPFETNLSPQALGRFLAFRPDQPCPHIQDLHEAALRAFEPFRGPLSEKDRARRLAAGLSPEQADLLEHWGYPFVLGHFRFHMTLTGSLANDGLRQQLLQAANAWFAADCGPHRFASVSLFRQADRSAAFTMVAQAPFAG